MGKEIKVSDYIVEYFSDKKLDKCFCVTGGGAMHLNDSFGHSDKFDVIYNHHEQACSMAAEGYTRLKNKPAIVLITSGPGATNAITGVYGAWLDAIPMIVISGQMKRETILSSTPMPLRYLGFQESNIIPVVKSFTKYSICIEDVNYLKYHLDMAYELAVTGKKGPVWLDIPLDVQAMKIEDPGVGLDKIVEIRSGENLVYQDWLEEFFNRLNNAKAPVVMLGEEVRHSSANKIILPFLEKLGIPVVTEWNAHDLIHDDHPLNCGRPGTIGNRGGNFVVQNADLLIAIGCQLSLRQISYEYQNFAKSAFKIAVSIDKFELIKKTLKIDLPVVSDIKNFIKLIEENIQKINVNWPNWLDWSKKINKKYPVVTSDMRVYSGQFINIYKFMDLLSDSLTKKSISVLANGAACVCGLQAYKIKKDTRLFTNAGASSMGYGVAAAIGAASDGDMVVCIEGDGSIMMNLAEIQTIVTNKLNVKIFVLNNNGYHSIRQTQKNLFDATERGYCGADPSSGLEVPNFSKIADSFGIKYFRLDYKEDINDVLQKILKYEQSSLCEVFIDPDQEFQPKLVSKMNEDGTFSTPSLEDMYPFLSKDEMNENTYQNK